MAGVRAEAVSAAGLSDQRQRLGRHGGGHGTCGSPRALRGRPPPPGRRLEEAAAESPLGPGCRQHWRAVSKLLEHAL